MCEEMTALDDVNGAVDNDSRRERWEQVFGSAVVGQFSPYRLVSLWDLMFQFDLLRFIISYRTVSQVEIGIATTHRDHLDHIIVPAAEKPDESGHTRSSLGNFVFAELMESLQRLGFMPVSMTKCAIVHEIINRPYAYRELQTAMTVLRDTIEVELRDRLFLFVRPENAVFWDKKAPFGEKVANAFPNATFDSEEATRCFAAGRYTACVMHLMRVTELGVRRLATLLRLPKILQVKPWGNTIEEGDKKVAALPHGTPEQQARRAQFSEILAHLRNIKNAWRDQVMHPNQAYDEERAREIFDAVKRAMCEIAELKRLPK